ncbi:MAG: hypothetical protein GY754_06455 [bacterium]|nr:hypothetical protein [bacterium]
MSLYKHISAFIIIFVMSTSLFGCMYDFTIGLWEDGIIPFFLSGDFNSEDEDYIKEAMDVWEANCGVRFEQVTPSGNAYQIIFVNENRWSSSIGENNAKCHMIFGNGSDPLEHIIHELGHCLGLLHEHQRPDRDQYINVYWDLIYDVYEHNFEIIDNPLYVEQDYIYDYQSIMHYPEQSFGIFNAVTIEAKDSSDISRIGTTTETDIAKAKEIYGSPLEHPGYCYRFCD